MATGLQSAGYRLCSEASWFSWIINQPNSSIPAAQRIQYVPKALNNVGVSMTVLETTLKSI